jgi:ABC-type lipoprotein export system ATPase subunit
MIIDQRERVPTSAAFSAAATQLIDALDGVHNQQWATSVSAAHDSLIAAMAVDGMVKTSDGQDALFTGPVLDALADAARILYENPDTINAPIDP